MPKTLVILFGMDLTASLLWPSEGAIKGDGLHLVVLWLLTLAAAFGGRHAAKAPGLPGPSWNGRVAGVAVLMLLVGFWLSTANVFHSHGDRRSALNLAFEWTALGSAWWLTRLLCRHRQGGTAVVILLMSLGAGAAVLGICQHHITFPRQAAWYLQQRERLDSGPLIGAAAASEFERMEIPTSGPARDLFERRLLSSTEPVGPFALANTLGGLLAVAIVLLAGTIIETAKNHRGRSALRWMASGVFGLVLGYCMVLTKSRTAWVGCVAGFAALFLQHRGSGIRIPLRRMTLVATALTGLLVAAGVSTGAIDKEVVLESPRSLQFRLFYWLGAAGVIREAPILGAGPGNFRQAYLAHKLPESSEEILDPHNLLFDAWASVGIVGFLGAVLVVSGPFWRLRSPPLESPSSTMKGRERLQTKTLLAGLSCGLALHLTWSWVRGGDLWSATEESVFAWGNGVWIVAVTGLVAATVLLRFFLVSTTAVTAAFAALAVHLMGAGGLQITGIMLILIILHAAGTADTSADPRQIQEETPFLSNALCWGAMAAILAVAWCVVQFGVIPVQASGQQMSLARLRNASGDVSGAEKALRTAIEEDPLGVESCQRKAELLTYEFMRLADRMVRRNVESVSDEVEIRNNYQSAAAAAQRLIHADQRSWVGYYLRSLAAARCSDLLGDSEAGRLAVRDLQHAVAAYPTNASLWSELAVLYNDIGDRQNAETAAGNALRQDRINHEWGHLDRFLNDGDVLRMNSILSAGP